MNHHLTTRNTAFQHPEYRLGPKSSSYNDVALFQLANPVALSDTANLVCLPDINEVADISGIPITTSGWGTTEESKFSPVLRSAILQQAPPNICEKDYGDLGVKIDQNINICCANPQSSISSICHGDSGGK